MELFKKNGYIIARIEAKLINLKFWNTKEFDLAGNCLIFYNILKTNYSEILEFRDNLNRSLNFGKICGGEFGTRFADHKQAFKTYD